MIQSGKEKGNEHLLEVYDTPNTEMSILKYIIVFYLYNTL